MPTYDGAALCCISMLVVFAVFLNLVEVSIITRQMTLSRERFTGEAFDCAFYPLVGRLVCVSFVGVASFTCLLASGFLVCFSDMGVACIETVFTYSLYMMFGPMLLGVSFFFLLNYEQYGYSCTRDLRRVYNPSVKLLLSMLCFISIFITFMCCIKTWIRKLTCMLRNNDNWFTRLVNCLVCTPTAEVAAAERRGPAGRQDVEEVVALRSQL